MRLGRGLVVATLAFLVMPVSASAALTGVLSRPFSYDPKPLDLAIRGPASTTAQFYLWFAPGYVLDGLNGAQNCATAQPVGTETRQGYVSYGYCAGQTVPESLRFSLSTASGAPYPENAGGLICSGPNYDDCASISGPGPPGGTDPCSSQETAYAQAKSAFAEAEYELSQDSEELAQNDLRLLKLIGKPPETFKPGAVRQAKHLANSLDGLGANLKRTAKSVKTEAQRLQHAEELLNICHGEAGDVAASRPGVSKSGPRAASAAASAPCSSRTTDTALRDATLIERLPKLTPLVRKILNDVGKDAASMQRHHALLVKVLTTERKLATGITRALSTCTMSMS